MSPRTRPRLGRRGFSLLEMAVVLSVGSILLSMAITTTGPTRSRGAIRSARVAFSSLQYRARSRAVERGQTARLEVDFAGDSAWITQNGATIETVRFGSQLGVDLRASVSSMTLCMTARGFADPGCNVPSTEVQIAFVQGGESMRVTVLPLGQVIIE